MVRGDERITAAANEYFPYDNLLPRIQFYNKEFESRVMIHLMRWEGTAPWAPPYVWPPLGGEELFRKFVVSVHDQGNLVGVYGSGLGWTEYSLVSNYDRRSQSRDENLTAFMATGPKGELESKVCDSIRHGYDMCVSEEWPRRTMIQEIEKVASSGVDFFQMFDQNQGGAARFCYAKNHRHPPNPGRWQTAGMRSLLEECGTRLAAVHSRMLLGTEAAAAEAFLDGLQFNDLRYVYAFSDGLPVPLYSYVFHEYSTNFMGNQVEVHTRIDCAKSPDNLLYRTAYAFNSGDMLCINLGPDGKINWGAAASWKGPFPDQENVLRLIRNLNRTRRQYKDFMLGGRMEKPLVALTCGTYILFMTDGRKEHIPSVLNSAWTSRSGERIEVLVNFLPVKQDCRVEIPDNLTLRANGIDYDGAACIGIPPLSAVCFSFVNHGKISNCKTKEE